MSQKIKFEETSFLILVKDQEIFSKKLINYINKQNIDGEFIIADGSKKKQKKIFEKLKIKKKYYYFGEDKSLEIYFKKILKSLNKSKKKFIFFCDQDDLVNFKTIKKKEEFLLKNNNYSAAKGILYDFCYINEKINLINKTYSNLIDFNFYILRQIFNINFRSYYCLHRRNNLVKFFKLICKYKLKDFRSSEFIIDFSTINIGRIKMFKDISVLRWAGIKTKDKKHPLNIMHSNRYDWFKYFFSKEKTLINELLKDKKIYFSNFYIFKIFFFITDILSNLIKKNYGFILLIRIIRKIYNKITFYDKIDINNKLQLKKIFFGIKI